MHQGLLTLTRLQARSVVRRMFRGAKTPRGAIFLIVGTVVFTLWMVPTIIRSFLMPRTPPERVQAYFPLAMLAFCLTTLITTAGERAISFTPAEVDFLFPGPFSRRQLLGYKIARSAWGALFTATIFSVVFMPHTQHWISGWIGIFLGLLFLQLLSMAVVLVGQMIGERAFTKGRKLALIGVAVALASIVGPQVLRSSPGGLEEIVQSFTHSTSGRIVLAPFSVFGNILTAAHVFPDALKWAAIALVMTLVLLLVVFRLDAHYLETAASSGQKVYDRTQRFRRGGGLAFRAGSSRARVPMFPRLGGAGAVAWRQLVTALRTAKSLLIVLLLLCICVGPAFYTIGIKQKPEGPIVGVMFWVTFMLANMLRFDFRGDLDHIDTLKSLPAPPASIAIAQIITPTLVLTIFQAVLLGSVAIALRRPPAAIALGLIFAIPINALLIAVENLIFLIFPMRAVAVSPGDLQGFGRQMLVFLLKTIVLLGACMVAGGVGMLCWWLGGYSRPAFIIAALTVIVAELVAMIPLLVMAFRKFDPSVDTPA